MEPSSHLKQTSNRVAAFSFRDVALFPSESSSWWLKAGARWTCGLLVLEVSVARLPCAPLLGCEVGLEPNN